MYYSKDIFNGAPLTQSLDWRRQEVPRDGGTSYSAVTFQTHVTKDNDISTALQEVSTAVVDVVHWRLHHGIRAVAYKK